MDSDDEESENYVLYGSALDPIEEDGVTRKKPFILEEQVALDKQGRRRFHGAFTGGFSAGFFNTVGTLEGWKPSSFKSSRSERGGGVARKPEDYMDEEDMEEFGIAPKVIRTTSDYRDHHSRKRERSVPTDGPIPGVPVLHSILQPVRDTVGVRLLKQMGWKPGQGVGPRVTKLEKRRARKKIQKQKKKVYGCSLPDEFGGSAEDGKDDSTDEDNDDEEEILYAPDDIAMFKCKSKNDFFGIGYSGLDRRPVLSQDKSETQNSILNIREKKNKFSISGQAFGVGAFEEEDEDIYSTEDMSHYDFSLEEENQKKSKVKGSRWGQEVLPNYAGSPLEGFVLARCRPKFQYFPPPKLPPDFQPFHKVRQTRFEAPANDGEVSGKKQGLRRHDITAADREAILSETPRTVDSTAVPQLLTSSEIKAETVTDVESSGENDQPCPPSTQGSVTSKGITQFRPFAANPDKQHRYEQYLGLLKVNQKGRLTELQPLSMTEWERDRERVEFEQAAKLYKPLMGLMFDRFVSAMHPDVGDDGSDATIRFPKEEESEKKKAAKMKMYGRMTREKAPWTPCSLLYKRFNVPDPGISAEPEVKRKYSKFSVFDFMASSTHNSGISSEGASGERIEEESTSDAPVAHQSTTSPAEVHENPEKDITSFAKDPKHQDEDTNFPTNKIDLFKAIFLSSSESESEEDAPNESENIKEVQETRSSVPERTEPTRTEETPSAFQVNVERNTSPPRGVFANLDLDSINNRFHLKKDDEKVGNPSTEVHNNAPPKVIDVDIDSGTYGPKLPDKFRAEIPSMVKTVSVVQVSSGSSSSEEVEWVEKSSRKSKKSKHHKSHRKKSKKYKSKHKHKRK